MAWEFEPYKSLPGMGRLRATVMVIAGAIGAGAVVWFMRAPADQYYTTRDEAEIVLAWGERENALWNVVDTNWAPLGSSVYDGMDGWRGYFASTNGTFYTNALGMYASDEFFANLDAQAPIMFRLVDGGNVRTRKWVYLPGSVWSAYGDQPGWDLIGTADGSWTNYPYAIEAGWWRDNIWDGATWFPTNIYVTTNTLNTIARALTACRHTVERGVGAEYWGLESGSWPFDAYSGFRLRWRVTIERPYTTSFLEIMWLAFQALQTNAPAVAYSPAFSTAAELYAVLPYCRVDEREAWIQLSESGTNATPRVRTVVLTEYVTAEPWGCVTVGTNRVVYGFGYPESIARNYTATRAGFWHPDYAETEPGVLVGAVSTNTVAATASGNTASVSNAFVAINAQLAWDGLFAWNAYTHWIPAAPTPSSGTVTTNTVFGWQQPPTNHGFVVEWQFEHMTNRAAFWGAGL